MSTPLPRAEREARRALLQDALIRLGESDDADRAAFDVMRALDAYMDAANAPAATPSREVPVMGDDTRSDRTARIIAGGMIGAAVVATVVVAVSMSGGWPAGVAVAAIWLATLGLLLSAT